MKKAWKWAAAVIVVVVVVAALSNSDKQSPAKVSSTTDAKACRPGSAALKRALQESLTITGGGGIEQPYIAEVEDGPPPALRGYAEGVYAVAARFTGNGMGETIGVWAASKSMVTTTGGLIIGGDAVTREFSEFGAAAKIGSPAADYADAIVTSSAGRAAKDCAAHRGK